MFKSKEDIQAAIQFLAHELQVPQDQICLGGGGALLLMGVRESTEDLNLWIDSPHFERICEQQKVTNHPMTDTVVPFNFGLAVMNHTGHQFSIPVPDGGWQVTAWIRERNRYFKHVDDYGIPIFDALTLSIHKHGGMIEVKRPKAKRDQDRKDIRFLNDLLAERNKVKEVA